MIGGHPARSHLSLGSPPGFIGGVRGGDSGGLSGALPGEQGGISTWAARPSWWPVHKVRAGVIFLWFQWYFNDNNDIDPSSPNKSSAVASFSLAWSTLVHRYWTNSAALRLHRDTSCQADLSASTFQEDKIPIAPLLALICLMSLKGIEDLCCECIIDSHPNFGHRALIFWLSTMARRLWPALVILAVQGSGVEHGGTDELRRKSKIIKGQHQKFSTVRDLFLPSHFSTVSFFVASWVVTFLGCGPSMSQLDPGRDDGKSARPGMHLS